MPRRNILIWHIHGSYLNTLSHVPHNWFVPMRPGGGEGYWGRGRTFDMAPNVTEVPAESVSSLDLDLLVFQTPANLEVDQFDILTSEQRLLPKIYLEHNTPKPDAVRTVHPLVNAERLISGSSPLLIHVTDYNALMWDNAELATQVIEHSVSIAPTARYTGEIPRGVVVANGLQRRARIAGLDLVLAVQREIPIDLVGMETEDLGGLGDVPYRDLHRLVGRYRFLFSPMRYTSFPLAVVEAMTLGAPVVALPTTAIPSVIQSGFNGLLASRVDKLVEHMRCLLDAPLEARRLGQNAAKTAAERFGLARFIADWNAAIDRALHVDVVEPAGATAREVVHV